MGKMVRSITMDGSAMACVVEGLDIVQKMQQIHQTSPVVTVALGRLTLAASIMGAMQKGVDDTVTLRVNGKGPIGSLIAVANAKAQVKSYAENPVVELEANQYGKWNVAEAVGRDGLFSVVKDIGLKEPYMGQIPLVSGEIAEDVTRYYADSEQTPSVCGLGVWVDGDGTLQAAGGYLVQLLPFADESVIDKLEENLEKIPPISRLFQEGYTPEQICEMLLEGLEPNVLDTADAVYQCDCSRSRVERALLSLGREELQEMIDEEQVQKVSCHFCNHVYRFTPHHLQQLLQQGKDSEKSEEKRVDK